MEKKRGRKRKIVTEVTEIVKDEARELAQDVKKEVSEGLGDTLEKVFKATGIDKVAKWIAGEDCGCDKRKERLNELFPYRKANCLTEDEYQILNTFFARDYAEIKISDQHELLKIYNRVLNLRQEATSCSSCWRDIIAQLKKIHKEYANS
jgi:hypothetical protein